MSAHEECAVELAVQIAAATGGTATVLTLGDADAVEQLRAALAVGCTAAVHVVADSADLRPGRRGPRDRRPVARRAYDLVLLGNDAADSGDFQVGIRLAYELGRPVVNGVSTVSVDGDRGDGERRRPGRARDLPGAAARRGHRARGRRRAALPDRARPDEGQEGRRSTSAQPTAEPVGPARVRLLLPAAHAVRRADPRQGRRRRARRGRPARAAGGAGPMILVLVETTPTGEAVEVSREALTFARSLAAEGGGVPVDAVVVGEPSADAGRHARGVRRPHGARADRRRPSRRTPAPPGPPASRPCAARSVVVMAAGTPRGNEVMAHVAAREGVAMAANVLSFSGLVAVRGHPPGRRRRGAGGDAAGRPAGGLHRGRARGRGRARRDARTGRGRQVHTPEIAAADLVARVVSSEEPEPDLSGTLKSARVVVGAGRGAGQRGRVRRPARADRAGRRLARASRGWSPRSAGDRTTSRSARPAPGSRPTSTSPAASAAPSSTGPAARRRRPSWRSTPTPDAPMVTKASYAVIGDLHEVVPAINAEIRRRRGA